MQASEQLVPSQINDVINNPATGVAPEGYFRIVVFPSPFRSERREIVAPVGTALRDLVEDAVGREINDDLDSLRVAVNDGVSETADGFDTKPGSGDLVIVRVTPGLSPAWIIGLLVVSATLQIAGYATGNQTLMYIGAGVGMLAFGAGLAFSGTAAQIATMQTTLAYGSIGLGAANLLGSLVAPQSHNRASDPSNSLSSSGFLRGVGNRATPWQPIPFVLGNAKFAPPLGGQQINEVVGDVVWLRTSFCLGYGPVSFSESDIFLGETQLSASEYDTYEVELRHGFPEDAPGYIYSGSFSQQQLSAKLSEQGQDQENWLDLSPYGPWADSSSHSSNAYVTTPNNFFLMELKDADSTLWSDPALGFNREHEWVQWGAGGANEGRGITYRLFNPAGANPVQVTNALPPDFDYSALSFQMFVLWDRNEGNWPKPGDTLQLLDGSRTATVVSALGSSIPRGNSGIPASNSEGVTRDSNNPKPDTGTSFIWNAVASPERTQTGRIYDPAGNTAGAAQGDTQVYIGRGDAQSYIRDYFGTSGRWFSIVHRIDQGGVVGGVEVDTYAYQDNPNNFHIDTGRVEGFLFREVSIGESVSIQLDDNTWQEVVITKKSDNVAGRTSGNHLGWGGPEGVYDSNVTADPRTTDQMFWTKVEFTPGLAGPASRRNDVIRFGARWETRTTPADTIEYTIILHNPSGMYGPDQSTRYNDIMVWHRENDAGGGVPGRWIAVGLAGDTNYTDFPMANVTLVGENFTRESGNVNRLSSDHVMRWASEVSNEGFSSIRVSGLPSSQYDVRVGVGNYGWDRTHTNEEIAEVNWVALTANATPTVIAPTVRNLAYVNVLLKSTSERTGVIDELRVDTQALMPYYTKGNGSNNGYWTDPKPMSVRGRVDGSHATSNSSIDVYPWDYYQIDSAQTLSEASQWLEMDGVSSDLTFQDSDKILIQSSPTAPASTTVGGQSFSSDAKLKYTITSVDRTNNRIKLDRGLDDDGLGKWTSASGSALWIRTDVSGEDAGLWRLEANDPVRIQKSDSTWFSSTVSSVADPPGSILLNDPTDGGVADGAKIEFDHSQFKNSSPAWAFASVLRGSAQATPIEQSHIDSDSLVDWHQMTLDPAGNGSQPAMGMNTVVDFRATTFDLLSRIASGARASIHSKDARVGVIYDRDRSSESPIQMFTARNIVKGSYGSSWTYTDLPHAVRVQYNDAEGRPQELVTFREGYNLSGAGPDTQATRFDSMSAWGLVTEEEVTAYSVYQLKQMDRRNEVVTIGVDIEASIVERGDVVLLSHDAEFTGLAYGRVKEIGQSGGLGASVESITLDETLTYEQSYTYKIKVRRQSDNDFPEYDVDNPASSSPEDVVSNLVTFDSPVDEAEAPGVGDVVVLGTATDTPRRMLVNSVIPQADLSVKLTLIPESNELFSVDLANSASGGFTTASPVGNTFGYTKPDRPTILSSRTRAVQGIPSLHYIEATVSPPGISYGVGGATYIEVRWQSGMPRPRGGPGKRANPNTGTRSAIKSFSADTGTQTVSWPAFDPTDPGLGKQITVLARTVRVGAFGEAGSRVASNWIRSRTAVPLGEDAGLISTVPFVSNMAAGTRTPGSDSFSFDGTDAKASWSSAVVLSENAGDMSAAVSFYGGLTSDSPIAPSIEDMSFNVGISDSASGKLLRTVSVPGSESGITYSLEDNIADGGPYRSISFLVTPTHGGKSGKSRTVSAVNEAHPAPKILSISQSLTGLIVTLARNWDIREDLAGAVVWASQKSGFTPNESTRIYSGPMREVLRLPTMEAVTWYFRVAAFDCYFRDDGDYSDLVKTDEFATRLIPSTDTQSLLLAETGGNLHPDPILKYSGEMGAMHKLMTADSPAQYNLADGTVRDGDVSATGGWSVCTAENSITPVNGAYMLRHHSADTETGWDTDRGPFVVVPKIEGAVWGVNSYDPASESGIAEQQGIHAKSGERIRFAFQANRTSGSNLSSGTLGNLTLNFYDSQHRLLSYDPTGSPPHNNLVIAQDTLLADVESWTQNELEVDVPSGTVTTTSRVAYVAGGNNAGLLVYAEPDHCVSYVGLTDLDDYADAGATKTDGAPLYFGQFDFRKLQLTETIAQGAVTSRSSYKSTADAVSAIFYTDVKRLSLTNDTNDVLPVDMTWDGNHTKTSSHSTGTVSGVHIVRRLGFEATQTAGGGSFTNTVTLDDVSGLVAGDLITYQLNSSSSTYFDVREIQSINTGTKVVTTTANFLWAVGAGGEIRKMEYELASQYGPLVTLDLAEAFSIHAVDPSVGPGTFDYQFLHATLTTGAGSFSQTSKINTGANYDVTLVKR